MNIECTYLLAIRGKLNNNNFTETSQKDLFWYELLITYELITLTLSRVYGLQTYNAAINDIKVLGIDIKPCTQLYSSTTAVTTR